MTTFARALHQLTHQMKAVSKPIHSKTWQSIDVSKRPEAEMRELTNVKLDLEMPSEDLSYYRDFIQPNLPWADQHFIRERISGSPINPGTTWKDWPYANSAGNFLEDGIFSHTYAERYWPKKAGGFPDGEDPNWGIRYAYGDLDDVVKLLADDRYTRQAVLPVWFPEDTGVAHGKRVPCSLLYHWMMRDQQLDVYYPIRSCDFVKHFRDDLYLTVRLTLWMLNRLRDIDPFWKSVTPGSMSFWAGSLHCFVNEWRKL